MDEIDRLFQNLGIPADEEARSMGRYMLSSIANLTTAEQVWELYRDTAIAPGSPPLQLHETRRAIFWALAVAAQIAADPVRLNQVVAGVRDDAITQLRRRG